MTQWTQSPEVFSGQHKVSRREGFEWHKANLWRGRGVCGVHRVEKCVRLAQEDTVRVGSMGRRSISGRHKGVGQGRGRGRSLWAKLREVLQGLWV